MGAEERVAAKRQPIALMQAGHPWQEAAALSRFKGCCRPAATSASANSASARLSCFVLVKVIPMAPITVRPRLTSSRVTIGV